MTGDEITERLDALEAMVRSEAAWIRGCLAVLEDARHRSEAVTPAPGPGQLDDDCPT